MASLPDQPLDVPVRRSRPSIREAYHRGRVSHADVPFTPPWYEPFLEPVVFLANLAASVWIYPCWRTIRVAWDPPPEVLGRLVESTGRPLLYYTWHAYSALSVYSFRDVPHTLMPTVIGNDGFKSRVAQRVVSWFGWHVWLYRRRSPVPRRQQIIDFVRSRGHHIAVMSDAGGPYGRFKPGLIDVAQAMEAWMVPFVLDGRRILRFERPRRYRVPLPFCSITLHYGDPLDGCTTTVEQCQQALDDVEERIAT